MEDERQIQFRCTEHGTSFFARAGRGVTVFCGNKEDAHVLAQDFPGERFWEYCCDCERFFPLRQPQEDTTKPSNSLCPACDRASGLRFLCSQCNVASFESWEAVGQAAAYFISATTGRIHPRCPGCLNKSSLAVRSHKCRLQRIGFTTTREQCPFCKEAIHPDSHDVDTEAGASAVAPADGTVAAEAAVPLTSAESASQLAAGNGHTPDVAHEADSETTPDEDDTTAPVSSPIGASRLRDRLLFLKQKKVTLGSAAILIPLLLYPFQEPIKGWVRAWVTNSRPVIDGIEAGKTIYAGGSIQLTGMARDANGDKLTYTWKGPSEGKIEGDGKTVLLNLADSVAQPGEVLKVTLVVSDQDVSSEPYTKEIHVVPVPSNHDPELSPITAVPAQVTAGKSVKLSTGATDPDGDAPTYEWSCSSGWFEGNNINSATVVLNTTGVTVLPSTSMNIKVTATVRDRRGGHDTKTIDVSVVAPREAASPSPTPQSAPPNDAPQVVIAPPDRLTIIAGESLRLLANATDQSGDELKYEWHVGNTNARIDGDGPDVTLNTSGLKALTVPLRVSITLIVKNWHGGKSLPAQIYIEVRPPEPASVGPVPSAHPEPNASVSPTPSPSPEAKPSGR